MKLKTGIIALLVMYVSLFASCSRSETSSSNTPAPPVEAAQTQTAVGRDYSNILNGILSDWAGV